MYLLSACALVMLFIKKRTQYLSWTIAKSCETMRPFEGGKAQYRVYYYMQWSQYGRANISRPANLKCKIIYQTPFDLIKTNLG